MKTRTCERCHGKGSETVRRPIDVYPGGISSGSFEVSSRTCGLCGGAGILPRHAFKHDFGRRPEIKECPTCKGAGEVKVVNADLPCPTCRDYGTVSVLDGAYRSGKKKFKAQGCPTCQGKRRIRGKKFIADK
jgi:DnaJ-class molecular chaperone